MKNEELIELIEDLQKALSKALNNEVIREYDHLQVRAEIAVKKLTIPVVSNCTTCNDEINYKGVCEMCYTELKLNDLD